MSAATEEHKADRKALPSAAREAMERLNKEAAGLNIWLRTQANAPSQKSWFRETGLEQAGALASGRVAANQMKALPYRWRWKEIGPYLDRISEIAKSADVPPIEFADRQQFLLTNPGLGGRLQVTSVIRCAISVYNPGDVAPVHMHTPNASRTILSAGGGYTIVEGEKFHAERGDLILTPNGTWHGHGNDGTEPIIWMDVLDWPLLDYLDCIWLRRDYDESKPNEPPKAEGYSQRLYAKGGVIPRFVPATRGTGVDVSPTFQYRGRATREALNDLKDTDGSPYEGVIVEFVNPIDGHPVFPTLTYKAQLLRPGEATQPFRHTASGMYVVLEGTGYTEVDGRRLEWSENDFFVIPNHMWRRHVNLDPHKDAVIYQVTDEPLLKKIGQYRAQGRTRDGAVVALEA
jgi:gentisate 1,2-dioxygenase